MPLPLLLLFKSLAGKKLGSRRCTPTDVYVCVSVRGFFWERGCVNVLSRYFSCVFGHVDAYNFRLHTLDVYNIEPW